MRAIVRGSTVRFSYQLIPEQPLDQALSAIELMDRLGYWGCYSADD